MERNKRTVPRLVAHLRVEMTHPDLGTVVTNTKDLSEKGAFVFTRQECIPELNSRIHLKVLGLPGEATSPVESEVVRVEDEGIGVRFIVEKCNAQEEDEEFLHC